MPQRLKQLHITKIALVPKGANQEAHVLLYKSATPPEEEEMPDTVLKADHDAVVAKLTTAEATIATLTEQVKKLTPPNPDDIWKGVPEVVRKRVEASEARAKQAEEAVELEKAERQKVLYIVKARSYKFLPVNPDDDWEVFKSLASLPQPVQDRLDTLFKAAEELGRQAGLTRPWGRDGVPADGDAPLDQLTTLARSYVAKGMVQTEAEGLERAIAERPDLYQAYGRGVQKKERD